MQWRRKWQPTQVFLPGESQGWGSLVGCRLWGRTESDTTEATWQQQQQDISSVGKAKDFFFTKLSRKENCLLLHAILGTGLKAKGEEGSRGRDD